MELYPRPIYPGPTPWNFQVGNGLDIESTRRARMTEDLLVSARHDALARRRQREIAGLEAGPLSFGPGMHAGVTPQLPPQLLGRAVGVDDGMGYDAMALSGGNAAKINGALAGAQQQLMQPTSGGMGLNPVQAGMAAADMGGTAMSLMPQPVVARSGFARTATAVPAAAAGSINLDAPMPARVSAGPALSLETPNVSGGGPGTSTAQGNAAIARKLSGGKGMLSSLDDFISAPGHSIGRAAEGGVRNAAAMAHKAGMPGTAGMLKGLAPAARWAAPVAGFAATTGLPAVMGAIEGGQKAGTGGAVLQGGGALAGALIGQALIPVPFLGAGIGSMIGGAIGSGLTGGAQALAEQGQMGNTGLLGDLGRAVDPFIDTSFEREQKAVQQQLNSPAMQAIRQQETARQEQARADQMRAVLMQSYLR